MEGLLEKYPALPALLFCGIIFAGYAALNLWKDPQQVKKSRYNLLFKLLGVAFLLFRYDIQDKGLPELLMVTAVLLCGLHLVSDGIQYRKDRENTEVLKSAAVEGFQTAGFVLVFLVLKLLFFQ
ncbi:MAG: hypothetical protein VB096_03065 [Pseudoflavonifractor sp.]|nr:hypothetical protein [Pseudoflavonifractor sp.]